MPLEVLNRCPECELILLRGCLSDAMAKEEHYGPILGLNSDASKETALAGYVGISSYYDPVRLSPFYRCPRCGADPVVEILTKVDAEQSIAPDRRNV